MYVSIHIHSNRYWVQKNPLKKDGIIVGHLPQKYLELSE